LERTRSESRFRERWQIVPSAVTAKGGGTISFTVFPPGSDVFEGIRDTGRGGAGRIVEVPTTTVDAEWVARGRPPVSLLKVDVEGADLDVIRGAEQCLRECRPVIVTEWTEKNFRAYGVATTAILDLAASSGYDVYMIPELNLVSDRRVFEMQLASRENLLLLPQRA
jgi:FkbM family methyltransferase